MRVIPYGVAEHLWSRYHAFKVTGIDPDATLRAVYHYGDAFMEAPFYRIEGAGTTTQLWVAAFPHLEDRRQALDVTTRNGTVLWHREWGRRGWKLRNSYTERFLKDMPPRMEAIELAHTDESAFFEPIGVYPYDDRYEVTRIRISFPEGVRDVELDPAKVLRNGVAKQTQVLECGMGDDQRWHIVLSYLLPKDEGMLLFSAPGGDGYKPWIFMMTPEYRSEMVQGFAAMTTDAAGDPDYASWFAAHRATEAQLAEQRAHPLPDLPLVSIVVPVYHPPMDFLRACVESVRAQSYPNWELIAVNANLEDTAVGSYLADVGHEDPRVKVVGLDGNRGIVGNTNAGVAAASGDWVAFLDQDDIIEPDALYEYMRLANERPEVGLIYCDEDSFTEGMETVFYPRLKPDFNPDALFSHNYVIHMLAARRDLLLRAGLSTPEVEGAQDYDLTLRMSEQAPVGHVPRVLYHWRNHAASINYEANESKPYVTDAAINALKAHFARTGIAATVEAGMRPGTHRVTYDVPAGNPMVSIIIPTKDHIDLLDACVTSLLEKAGWDNLEVLLVENNSTKASTFAFYDRMAARDPRIRVLRYEGSFNYASILNWAAAQANGDYLFLLNNDTVTLSDGAIRAMLGYFQRPDVGVVGPLLLFPDGLVQTAGIALMSDGRLGFINQNLTLETHGGYLASLDCPRDYSSVLGAAQMVPKALFDELGGYDERLAVTYNDVDFCWRVRETGRVVVYTPNARLSHREFATRGHDSIDPVRAAQTEAEAQLMRERWPRFFEQGDPVLNPQCDPASPWFKLRKDA